MFEFKKEYETGIQEIDREHKQFFAYINSAVEALDLPEDRAPKAASELLDVLMNYAETHFEHEEAYMRRINDDVLPSQKEAHDAFRARLAEMTARRDQLVLKDLGDIFIFMAKWLQEHIKTQDKKIGLASSGAFVMTDEFFTGIKFVDEEHATLFDIIGRVHETINSETLHDKFDAIMDIIEELRDYTIKHFSDEERYMQEISYDGLAAQKRVHEAFVDKITEIDLQSLSDDSDDQSAYLSGLVRFLNDWLIDHILKMDKKIPVKQ